MWGNPLDSSIPAEAHRLSYPARCGAVQGLAVPADKHRSGGDFLSLEIGTEQFSQPQRSHAAERKEPIDSGQLIVDAGRGIPADDVLLPLQQQALGYGLSGKETGNRSQVVVILLEGSGAGLLFPQKGSVFLDQCRCDGQILLFHSGILLSR